MASYKQYPHATTALALEAVGKRIQDTEKELEQLRGELPDLIRNAREKRFTMPEISELVGLSRSSLFAHLAREEKARGTKA